MLGFNFFLHVIFQIPEEIRQTEEKLAETKTNRKRSIGTSDNRIRKHSL